jgi:hypothetical protein
MPPPKSRVARLRAIAAQRWADSRAPLSSSASADAAAEDVTSGSDDEVYLLDSENDIVVSDVAIQQANSIVLEWKQGAKPKRPAVYLKDSERTRRRHKKLKAQMAASVSGCLSITSFFSHAYFPAAAVLLHENVADGCASDSEGSPISAFTLDEALEKIGPVVAVSVNRSHENRQSNMTKYDLIRYKCLLRYLSLLKSGKRPMEASMQVADLFPDRSQNYTARKIRKWAEFFLQNRCLPGHSQGKHIKIKSLVFDEDVASKCRQFLKKQINDAITGQSFAHWINNNLHIEADLPRLVGICSRTAMRWLHTLGMSYMQYTKGLYINGHERPDVVSYRDAFLERMSNHEKCFFKYEGDDTTTIVNPALHFGERPRVLVTHDESCFSSHDGKTIIWMDECNRPLRPKGQGRLSWCRNSCVNATGR